MTRIEVVVEIAARGLFGLLRMLGDIENVKVAEEGDARFGRHPASPGWSTVFPVTRVFVGAMSRVNDCWICVRGNADSAVLAVAIEYVPPCLRDRQS